jgi:mono/diheme cytochrome c family protein
LGIENMKRIVQLIIVVVAVILSSVIWLGGARRASGANSTLVQRDADTIYKSTCAGCLGNDGHATLKGKLRGAPNLNSAHWQEKTSDAHIFNVISNGKEKMPAFGKKLSQAEIESLVAYVRRFRNS